MGRYSPLSDQTEGHIYSSCGQLDLGSGLLVGDILSGIISYVDDVKFQSYCEEGLPVYNAAKITDPLFHYPEMVEKDWQYYITTSDAMNGSFSYGIYPVVLSFTANFVITVFLTLLTFINIKGKQYKHAARLLKIGSIITSINIVIFVTRALKTLNKFHDKNGVATTQSIMALFASDLTFSILDLISVFLLQLCQVMIVIRLFPRDLEKRIVFFLGVSLVLVANILWAIPQFADSINDGENHWEILSPFVYLFRIAVAASYASTIIFYGILKRRFCYASSQMAVLTALTALVVLLQPSLFLADVSNVWLSGVGELFNTTCYVGSTSIVWEWLERLGVGERKEQAQSILGRPIYEDEQRNYHVAKYALRVQDALTHAEPDIDDDGTGIKLEIISSATRLPPSETTRSLEDGGVYHTQPSSSKALKDHSLERESVNQVKFKQQQSFKEATQQRITQACDSFLYYADQAILKSLGTLSLSSKSTTSSAKREAIVRKRIGLDRPNEVYIYSTKDVVFESDGEDEVSVSDSVQEP